MTAKIVVPELEIKKAEFHIVGDSPLISHAWSKKAKEMMLARQVAPKSKKKDPRNPEQDFRQSLYYVEGGPDVPLDECLFGIPAIAFKAAAVDACSQIDKLTKVFTRSVFHIGDTSDAEELLTITPVGPHGLLEQSHRSPGNGMPIRLESTVRVGMGTADLRYRGFFKKWGTRFNIRYSSGAVSLEQLVVLMNTAGFGVGVGDYRPAKTGTYGTFHVAKVIELGSAIPEAEIVREGE